ncbi:MAG TPA: hypothetical protein VNH40_02690, partial [Gaiellaceae bacterium]|nr:hypothetical protein [Gaiellaceae bacterium]
MAERVAVPRRHLLEPSPREEQHLDRVAVPRRVPVGVDVEIRAVVEDDVQVVIGPIVDQCALAARADEHEPDDEGVGLELANESVEGLRAHLGLRREGHSFWARPHRPRGGETALSPERTDTALLGERGRRGLVGETWFPPRRQAPAGSKRSFACCTGTSVGYSRVRQARQRDPAGR